MRALWSAAIAAGFSITAGAAHSEAIAVCGAETGHAYFVEAGIVPKKMSGWSEDGTTGGRTTLSRDDKGQYDIAYADATGGVYSSRAEGAIVIAQHVSPDVAMILVAHQAATTDLYQFVQNDGGQPRLLHLQSKGADQLKKGGVYVSNCSYMSLPEK